jgi:CubicO group peptidase (beta-lactamase class C family)
MTITPILLNLALVPISISQAAPSDQKPLDSYLEKAINAKEIPGASIIVKVKGNVVLRKGFGFSNLETMTPMNSESVHELASVSKQFTAAATMLMIEDGKLQLSSPITDFIDDAPEAWKKITIEHLLHHTSGLPDYLFGVNTFTENVRPFTLINRLKTRKMNFEPGTKWEYSNSGFMMLGYIIDKISGSSFSEVTQKRIFEPAGMKTASITNPSQIVLNRASGYQMLGKKMVQEQYCSPGYSALGDGMVSASAEDLLAWQEAIGKRKILNASSWKFMFTPSSQSVKAKNPYSAGFGVVRAGDKPVVEHTGAWIGTSTYIGMNFETDSCMIILVNRDEADIEKIIEAAQKQFGKKGS